MVNIDTPRCGRHVAGIRQNGCSCGGTSIVVDVYLARVPPPADPQQLTAVGDDPPEDASMGRQMCWCAVFELPGPSDGYVTNQGYSNEHPGVFRRGSR
jgi:hypothetical protein